LEPIPHVNDLIAALETAGVSVCVGSNGSVSKMTTSLGITGLLRHFEARLFSGQEMARGKPFPDLFLHAAKTMGVAPGDCVVIEDSTAGLKAAQAAGMRALAYVANPAHRPAGLAGGHPFTDMRQVAALLGL
jgi:HAD superfamily hydrolase (TIGR01509 family)